MVVNTKLLSLGHNSPIHQTSTEALSLDYSFTKPLHEISALSLHDNQIKINT